MRSRKIGESKIGNCWIALLILLFKNKGRVILVRLGSKLRPHPLLVTHGGRIVHFSSDRTLDCYVFTKGRIHVMSSRLLRPQRYWKIKL